MIAASASVGIRFSSPAFHFSSLRFSTNQSHFQIFFELRRAGATRAIPYACTVTQHSGGAGRTRLTLLGSVMIQANYFHAVFVDSKKS